MKSMAFMHGAAVHRYKSTDAEGRNKIQRAKKFVATGTTAPSSIPTGAKIYDEKGTETTELVSGQTYIAAWKETSTSDLEVITVSADSFPGTYRMVGDTYARSYKTGKDEFFQIEIPMAKVASEQTITMQAEGKLWGLLSLNSTNCWKLLRAC